MNRAKTKPRRGAFTLVELMVSLSIFSLMSTAIGSLMFYAYDVNRYTRAENQLVQQVESAMRRIIDNTRSSSSLKDFSSTYIYECTQADPDNGNAIYDVKYYLDGGKLIEYHELYGTYSVLVPGVTQFEVKLLQSAKPTMLEVTLTASDGKNTVSRTCNLTARNY
jgi:prepilin-type N-terminal cleavage/methylation domain-containing protein